MGVIGITRCLSVLAPVLFSCSISWAWATAALVFMCIAASLVRHPTILLTSIWNFGPLRNTVGLYVGNLPEHVHTSITEPLHEWLEDLKHKFAHREDQRGIVASGDDSESNNSEEETNSRARSHGSMTRRNHQT